MFYNELSAKYLFWTCQGIHSVFFIYFHNYLAAVSACLSHKWPRYIGSLFETRTPLHVLLRSPVETAAVMIVEYNLRTNLIEINSIEGFNSRACCNFTEKWTFHRWF